MPLSSPPDDTAASPLAAVTFDVGQTLTSLDTQMLANQVRVMGGSATLETLDAALERAWRAYNAAVRSKEESNTWKVFMATLLQGAGEAQERIEPLVDRLWREQPDNNLWRRPVEGMIGIVDALRAVGIPVGIVSNSEGRLSELLRQLGWLDRFEVVADSGALGIEKPDPRIFAYACDAMAVDPARVVHVGDSRAADVEGALGAGMRAIWFGGTTAELASARARVCSSPGEVLGVLREWGAPLA